MSRKVLYVCSSTRNSVFSDDNKHAPKENNTPMQSFKHTKQKKAFSENSHHPKMTCNAKICQCGGSFSPFLILAKSPGPDEPSSCQNSVCFHAGSAAPDLSTSSPALSQTLLILRCPAQPRAIHSNRENSETKKPVN